MLLCRKLHLLQFLGGLLIMTTWLSPHPCQVSDYSRESTVAACCCQPLSSPAVIPPLRPPHSVPCAAESCPARGGGAEAVLLQCYNDASGDRPGVRCLCDGPASPQSTDPGGVRDSATPTCQQLTSGAWPGRAGAALQEEEQAQNHAMCPGVNTGLHSGGRENNKNTLQCNKQYT